MTSSNRQLRAPSPGRSDAPAATGGRSLSTLFARKTVGTIILWGTVGLICLQALFYVCFGPAV